MGLYEWRLHILVAIVAVVLVLKIFLPMLLYLVFAILSVLCGAALAILQGRYKRRRKKSTTVPSPGYITFESVKFRGKFLLIDHVKGKLKLGTPKMEGVPAL